MLSKLIYFKAYAKPTEPLPSPKIPEPCLAQTYGR